MQGSYQPIIVKDEMLLSQFIKIAKPDYPPKSGKSIGSGFSKESKFQKNQPSGMPQ